MAAKRVTGSLGVPFKIYDDLLRQFYMGVAPEEGFYCSFKRVISVNSLPNSPIGAPGQVSRISIGIPM